MILASEIWLDSSALGAVQANRSRLAWQVQGGIFVRSGTLSLSMPMNHDARLYVVSCEWMVFVIVMDDKNALQH